MIRDHGSKQIVINLFCRRRLGTVRLNDDMLKIPKEKKIFGINRNKALFLSGIMMSGTAKVANIFCFSACILEAVVASRTRRSQTNLENTSTYILEWNFLSYSYEIYQHNQ